MRSSFNLFALATLLGFMGLTPACDDPDDFDEESMVEHRDYQGCGNSIVEEELGEECDRGPGDSSCTVWCRFPCTDPGAPEEECHE